MLQKVSQQQHITTMAYYTIVKSLSENCATESITATTHHHHGILHYSKVPLRELLQKVSQQQHITTMAYYTIVKSPSENCATESITATTHHHHGILHYNQVPLRELLQKVSQQQHITTMAYYTIIKSLSENCYRKYHSNNTSPPWHITL